VISSAIRTRDKKHIIQMGIVFASKIGLVGSMVFGF